MSHGSMAVTLKQKPSLPNGSHLSLHVRKRHSKLGATSRPWWWLFFYHKGVIHHEYAPPGQTLTKEYYIEVLHRLRDAIRRKWQFWVIGDWQLHHNNAPSSAIMQVFLAKHHITQVCQSPYSPDLAPCDFWLFRKLKSPLKGRRFVNVTVTQYTRSVNSVSLPTD